MKKFFLGLLFLLFSTVAWATPTPITLYSGIDARTAPKIVAQIQEANRNSKETDPIILYINSGGGDILAGTTIIDAMAASRRPVWTVDVAFAASMAAIIHSYGVRKFILPHAVLMHHEAEVSSQGTPQQAASFLAVLRRLIDLHEQHSAKLARMSIEQFRLKESENWWMLGEEAVKAHLADEVINPASYPTSPTGEGPKSNTKPSDPAVDHKS